MVSESEELLRKLWGVSKGIEANLKELPMAKAATIWATK